MITQLTSAMDEPHIVDKAFLSDTQFVPPFWPHDDSFWLAQSCGWGWWHGRRHRFLFQENHRSGWPLISTTSSVRHVWFGWCNCWWHGKSRICHCNDVATAWCNHLQKTNSWHSKPITAQNQICYKLITHMKGVWYQEHTHTLIGLLPLHENWHQIKLSLIVKFWDD